MSKLPKMTRQLHIFDWVRDVPCPDDMSFGTIIGPSELMNKYDISVRTLQRDLKDLRDCGLINVRYDRARDRYLISDKEPVFDESAGERRKQHLRRLYRLGTLIERLPCVYMSELDDFECRLDEYNDYVEWSREDPLTFTPEDIEKKYEEAMAHRPKTPDLKAVYHALFPNSSERTRQRDFKALRDAGFDIEYDKLLKATIYLVDDMDI